MKELERNSESETQETAEEIHYKRTLDILLTLQNGY
jgi:hypothetical protein